ncbi:hypothetical protein ACHHYP_00578 [Achlya hypogyna]|uniref:Amino acid transporter transmembrane domain-containing protein n=1 Tax=Achlya hypogyna TaxID=1202772 RepID=A0A1V9ZUB4_ACHHY|nr:hypothetical protein ACHHYP_00578 [Achlya hypogyna]
MEAPLAKSSSSVQSVDLLDSSAMGVKTYGSFVAVATTFNYMIGTGCFGLPYAFASAGIGLTSIFLIVGFFGALITMNYTLESMARADGVLTAGKMTAVPPEARLTYRKIDFSEIGEVFAGKSGFITVQAVLCIYCLGSLWSYASIYASSVASIFYSYALNDSCDAYAINASTGCLNAYYGAMVIFSVLSIILVLMDLGDQQMLQKFLSAYRIVAFTLMLVTLTVKLVVDGSDAISARLDARGAWAFNLHNFSTGFGPTLLALNCQYNMPNALQPLEAKEKKNARLITFGSMTAAGICYFLLGLLGALAFDNVNPLASLMWSDFTGCGNGWGECASGGASWLGAIVHIVILMFPVVNVTSAFPMVGLTVGCNILPSLPKSITAPLGTHRTHVLSRLIAVVPPLILAAVFKKIDAIFTFAGFFGFALGLIIPAGFQVVGLLFCRRVYGSIDAAWTPFTAPGVSSLGFSVSFLVFTFVVTLVALFSLVGF